MERYKLANTHLTKKLKSTPKKGLDDYKTFIKKYNKDDTKNLKKIVKNLTKDKFKKSRKGNKHSRKEKKHSYKKVRSPKVVVKKIEYKPLIELNQQKPNKSCKSHRISNMSMHSKEGFKSKSVVKHKSSKQPTNTIHSPNIKSKPKPKPKRTPKQDMEYIMKIKKKINTIKRHSLSKKKYSRKKTKNRHVIVNLKPKKSNDNVKKKNKQIKEKINNMSSKELRKILINKNVIKHNSKTPDKLLKDIYMYSELCNVNISK
jgi:hypothetical protein